MKTTDLTDNDLYYLRSISRNLEEWSNLVDETIIASGIGIGSEVLADNRNWLDCFIDEHERRAAARAEKR